MKIVIYFLLIVAVAKPIGLYIARVFERKTNTGVERAIYKIAGVDATREHDWMQYTIAMLVFSGAGLLLTYAIERLQHLLPLNPDKLGAVAPDLAWNTATSFTTNTNWQAARRGPTVPPLTQ